LRSFPRIAALLNIPMEVEPAWLTMPGRGAFGSVADLQEVPKIGMTGQSVRMAISALGVQETYAARCRRDVMSFLDFVKEAGKQSTVRGSVGEWMADFGGHLLLTRQGVRRSTTVRTVLVRASRPWPSAMHSQEVRAFMRGAEMVSPVLPEAAGVGVPRDVNEVRMEEWMVANACVEGGIAVALAAGLSAGLRLRESARILVRRGWSGFSVSVDGTARWKESSQLKQNLRGQRKVADRVVKLPMGCVPSLRALVLPWRVPDQVVSRVLREVSRSLRGAGVVMDVRAFRRTMAGRVREAAVAAGESETEAVRWAQRALSHQEGRGEAIFRYLPSLLSREGSRFLEGVQASKKVGAE